MKVSYHVYVCVSFQFSLFLLYFGTFLTMQQILKDNRHQLVNMPKLLSMELNQVYLLQWSWFRFHVLLYWIKIRTTGKISFSLMSDKYSKSYASMRMFLSFVYLYETITQDSVMWLVYLPHSMVLMFYRIKIMLFNATFNNISVISWWSKLLVEETGENHRPVTSHWQILSHNVVSSTPRNERDLS